MKDRTVLLQTVLYGGILILAVLSFPLWAMRKPTGVMDKTLAGNSDLLYFATDAPDTFIVYSPGRHENRLILPASERMADMVVSPDGKVVWTATKSGYVDRYAIPVDSTVFTTPVISRQKIAPVLSTIALSGDRRFVAVGYGTSEDYNSRSIKILPADKVSLADQLAEFHVAGDIQSIVAHPVENYFYVINSHSDRVRIINADRFVLEPEIIELGSSPGNFIIDPKGKWGYGAMNARKNITPVDLDTNQTAEPIPLGFPPYAMAFNADGSRLYVASRDSATVAILDTGTNTIVKTFDLPPRVQGLLEFNFPEMIGVSSDEKYLYIMPKRPELVVYDMTDARDPSKPGAKPVMVQSEVLAATPFYMAVVRGHTVPGA